MGKMQDFEPVLAAVTCHSNVWLCTGYVRLWCNFKLLIMEPLLLMRYISNAFIEQMEQVILLRYWTLQNDHNNEEFLHMIICIVCNLEHMRMPGYYNWINEYINYDFFSLFRMTKETFNALLRKLNCNQRYFKGGFLPIPEEQQVLMTLWWLGKGEVLLTIADRFNVAISTVYVSTELILSRLINLQDQYIVWPDVNESLTISERFQEKAGYPGVIGAIDVCNIPFKAPKEQAASYTDRKMQHSIKLQAICSSNKIFTNTLIGFPGSVHDSRVLRNSNLYHEVQINGNWRQFFYNEEYHILGDSAYPLYNWLMTPYRDNGRLTPVQRRHNRIHSATRVAIENSFGILKSRWRILRYINVNSVIKAVRVITACCVLHNFCYINEDIWENYEPEYNDDNEDQFGNDNLDMQAVMKRNNIANTL